MLNSPRSVRRSIVIGLASAVLAGCAGMQREKAPAVDETRCVAAAPGDPMIGNWLSVRRASGVEGELRTLVTLRADGTMSYEEQLSRRGRAPQGLAESGCWRLEGETLVLRTVMSNGSPVDLDDPIYVNRYSLTQRSGERIRLQAPDGARLDARRMPPDYRLPL